MARRPDLCRHGRQICSECIVVDDAARRAFDVIRAYVTFIPYDQRVRSWVALRLADGGHDGTLYDSKVEAIRHQADEYLCAYFSFRGAPDGFRNREDAAIWLQFHRAAYDRGIRLADPDDSRGGGEVIMPTPLEHMLGQRSRLILPGRLN